MIAELLSENSFLWTCLWQSTACVAAGLIGSFILRRRPARAHQVLLLAMVAAVAVPAMSVLVGHFDLGLLSPEQAAVRPQREITLPETVYAAAEITAGDFIEYELPAVEQYVPAAVGTAEKTQISWMLITAWAWTAASLILAARLLVTFVRGSGLLRRATPLDSISIQKAARIAKRNLGINQEVNVLSSDTIFSPVIWCWAKRPALLVPEDAVRADDGINWVSVLCHELAHYKRRDHISGLLAELAVCILPWNALLWWAKSRLIWLSEQACDDWVIAVGQPGPDYAKLLLDLLPQGQMAFVPTVVGSKKELQARVRRLVHGRCGNPRAGGRWAVLVTIVAACLALGTALAQERSADRERPRQEPAAPAYRPEREVPREPSPEQREAERAELMQHRRELLEQMGGIERELRALRDDQDAEARELRARLRTLREEIGRIDTQLGGPQRQREDVRLREQEHQLHTRELLAQREVLQKRLHELELALERLPDGREAEARELQAESQKIREQMRRVEDQLRDVELQRREQTERPEADPRMRELMEHREQLQNKARDIERRLTERPDSPEARELRAALPEIHEQIERINRKLIELRPPLPERPEQARLEELRRNIERLRAQGKYDEAERLERELRQVTERPATRPEPRPETPGLEQQVRQLRNEVQGLRQEMAELRELLKQLLQRQRPEGERIPERQRRPEPERREREPRREGEQIGVEGPRF